MPKGVYARRPRPRAVCEVCGETAKAQRLCNRHYQRLMKSGSVNLPGKPRPIKHGHAVGGKESRTYSSWRSMLKRCYDPRSNGYERWGGRGIAVCDSWRESFANFLADMGERPEGMTLDRIDNDRNYEPDNCRWATWSEQRRNQRRAVTSTK